MLRRESDDPEFANHVMHGEDDPALGNVERAMVAYARKLTREPWAMTESDLDSLRQAGLSEEQTLAAVLVACLFNFMTRLADGLGVDIEEAKGKAAAAWLDQRPGSDWQFLRLAQTPARRGE